MEIEQDSRIDVLSKRIDILHERIDILQNIINNSDLSEINFEKSLTKTAIIALTKKTEIHAKRIQHLDALIEDIISNN